MSNKADGAAILQGDWLTDGGTMIIRIAHCGWYALCGTIVHDMRAQDGTHPTTGADDEPIVGWQVLRDFVEVAPGEWQGRMHNVMNGRSFACKMHLTGPDQLLVRAYVGAPLLGQDHRWRRVDFDAG